MRIRSLLITGITMSITLTIGMWLTFWIMHQKLDQLTEGQIRAREVIRHVSALQQLSSEYAIYHQDRTSMQWQARHQRVLLAIRSAALDDPDLPIAAIGSAQAIAPFFEQFMLLEDVSKSPLQQQRMQLLFDQLMTRNQALFDTVYQWGEIKIRNRRVLEDQLHTVAFVLPLMMLLVLFTVVGIVIQRVLKPLDKLYKVVQNVSQGNLSLRSATGVDDELGLVSRTFDAMAIDLVGQLRERQSSIQQILDTSHVGIFRVDNEQRISVANLRMGQLFGCPVDRLIGQSCNALLSGPDKGSENTAPDFFAKHQLTEVRDIEWPCQRADGTLFWGLVTIHRYLDHRGVENGWLGTITDVSERKKFSEALQASQQQMALMERRSALGTLVGGVAHEVNNPLMGIRGYIEYALDKQDAERPREMLTRALGEVERVARIVRNMLVFARMQPATGDERCDPAKLIPETMSLIEGDLRKANINVHVDIPNPSPQLQCSPDALQQVLLNLLLNARDALKDRPAPHDVRISLARQENHRATLEVCDNGPGVPDNIKTQVFDPFFTTKPTGSGTGLGLSVSHQLITNAGGSLEVSNAPGGGALFRIILKVVGDA